MRILATALLAALALSVASAAPQTAGAAEATGNTTLVVAAGKARTLAARGIAISASRGATTAGRESRLQIAGGTIGDTAATFSLRGALRLTAGEGKERRKVLLRDFEVQLGAPASLSARLAGKRRLVFDLEAPGERLSLNPTAGTAQLLGARLIWRGGMARTLSRRLHARVPRGSLGTLRTKAAILLGERPESGPVESEPLLLARPTSAVDVSGGTLAWHVRDSWVRYVGSETAEAQEGAMPKPAYPGNEHPCPDNPVATNPTLVYSYEFPFSRGWYDPPTGTTALYYGGAIRFAYPSRGIDLTARNPEIEINGASSRTIFRLKGAVSTAYPDKRAAIMSLAVTAPPVESPPGAFAFADALKATLTADGETVFGGFYAPPNNGFGCFSVSFATG
jgi:hypothetical protein